MTTTKKGNTTLKKVEVKKAEKANVKTEEVVKEVTKKNATSILNGIDKSLFIRKERSGKVKDSFLKEDLFKGLEEKQKRTLRRKIRASLHRFSESFEFYKNEKDTKKLKALKEEFVKFYSTFFKVNDYSLNSLSGGNLKPEAKAEFQKMIEIIKGIK